MKLLRNTPFCPAVLSACHDGRAKGSRHRTRFAFVALRFLSRLGLSSFRMSGLGFRIKISLASSAEEHRDVLTTQGHGTMMPPCLDL